MTSVDAIILTGGSGRRLGGVDKASIRFGDATLLEHALAAAAGCHRIVVVGPAVQGLDSVTFTREDPPGGGPVAGIAAGLQVLDGTAAQVLVLACDMPDVGQAAPALLAAAATASGEGRDGAWGVDEEGRAQPLCAAYRRESLQRAVDALGGPAGASMRRLTAGLTMDEVHVGRAARDADTWDDVKALREERR